MANKTYQIKIESILGGQSQIPQFSRDNEFQASLGIDPSKNPTSGTKTYLGLLRPVGTTKVSGTVIQNAPLWIVPNLKSRSGFFEHGFIYDKEGSAYSIDMSAGNTVTALSDGGSLTNSSGNGCAYYDNYVYFAKDTTVARYGPLNGTPLFDGQYWDLTLGLTALGNTSLPIDVGTSLSLPNHVLHRHSDGRLYILDVLDNQGVIHFIQTSKTTVEGDTNNGSSYDVLRFGYGLHPTAIESYGENLVIALFEGAVLSNGPRGRAKVAFWDTVSDKFNLITLNEFPDEIITAIKNVNGSLYLFSGSQNRNGFRVMRYVGGHSFEEIFKFDDGRPPLAGAIDGNSKRLMFGSYATRPESSPCVYSLGLDKGIFGFGLFNIMNIKNDALASSTGIVSALSLTRSGGNYSEYPLVGWTKDGSVSGGDDNGLDHVSDTYDENPSVWWSRIFKIGRPFKITKIRIPLAQVVAANMVVTPKIYTDDGDSSKTLTAINNTDYSGKRTIVYRPENLTGENNFWLGLDWSGSALCVVSLPITIEYELIDD